MYSQYAGAGRSRQLRRTAGAMGAPAESKKGEIERGEKETQHTGIDPGRHCHCGHRVHCGRHDRLRFWDGGPTPGFFPIIIAVVLLLASIASFIQVARDKDGKDVQYNRAELMVILGAAGIIIGSMVIGLILSCLVYLVLWLKLVEHAPWKHVIIIEAILAAIIIGVFVVWLQVQFPMGLFEFIL